MLVQTFMIFVSFYRYVHYESIFSVPLYQFIILGRLQAPSFIVFAAYLRQSQELSSV